MKDTFQIASDIKWNLKKPLKRNLHNGNTLTTALMHLTVDSQYLSKQRQAIKLPSLKMVPEATTLFTGH